ncbi:MAG: hypothetical protein JWR52_1978 [Marmoricola sp.]|nr:hypothetical protein [Marmoricola sp.]
MQSNHYVARMSRPARFAVSVVLVAAAGVVLTSCGAKHVDAAALERNIKVTLDHNPQTRIQSVSCPSNVPSSAGRTFTCSVSSPSGSAGIVTVTVQDSQRHVRWKLTEVPTPDSDVLATAIQSDFTAQNKADAVASTVCPARVTLTNGATTTCTLTLASGGTVIATVSRDPHGGITWSYGAGK